MFPSHDHVWNKDTFKKYYDNKVIDKLSKGEKIHLDKQFFDTSTKYAKYKFLSDQQKLERFLRKVDDRTYRRLTYLMPELPKTRKPGWEKYLPSGKAKEYLSRLYDYQYDYGKGFYHGLKYEPLTTVGTYAFFRGMPVASRLGGMWWRATKLGRKSGYQREKLGRLVIV